MRDALNTGDPAVIAVTLELLVEFTRASPAVGEALVPYYRQLLPRLNALKDVDDVYVSLARLADARSWRERPPRANTGEDENDESAMLPRETELIGRGRSKRNIGSLVRRALRALERRGGADALANIKYHIPTYRSCARVE